MFFTFYGINIRRFIINSKYVNLNKFCYFQHMMNEANYQNILEEILKALIKKKNDKQKKRWFRKKQ